MEDLEARLDALEQNISGFGDVPALELGDTLASIIAQLSARWRALVEQSADARTVLDAQRAHRVRFFFLPHFVVAHRRLQRLLNASGPASNEANLCLLAANEKAIHDTASQLALVDSHTVYVNPETLDATGEAKSALARLQVAHLEQKERALAFNTHMETLLQHHHDMVFAVSSQLLRCDALLSKLEAAKAKAAPPGVIDDDP